MKKSIKLAIFLLPVIPIGAYLDYYTFGLLSHFSFEQYLIICTWEYAIAFIGIYIGEMITLEKNNKIEDDTVVHYVK